MIVGEILSPTILVVENDPAHILLLQDVLTTDTNYEVLEASNIADAHNLINDRNIHCLILDLSMVDRPGVLDGLQIADRILTMKSNIPIIFLTQFANQENTNSIYERYKDLVAAIVSKGTAYYDHILDRVQIALLSSSGIRWDLEIEFRDELDLDRMVELLEQTGADKKEVIELLSRGFSNFKKVDLFPLTPGHSGAGVIKAIPYVEIENRQRPGEGLVFKFGPQYKISKEATNFTKFVEHFSKGNRRTSMEDEPVFTRLLGGIKYRLLEADDITSFSQFYLRTDETKDVEKVITDLFTYSCSRWYSVSDESAVNFRDYYNVEKLIQEVKSWADPNLPELIKSPLIKFPELDMSFKNPLELANSIGSNTKLVIQSITHGDLNGNNILVNPHNKITWLIDFYLTGFGPLFRDFAKLETVIKFELFTKLNISLRFDVEKFLLEQINMDSHFEVPSQEFVEPVEKLLETIGIIRHIGSQYSIGSSNREIHYLLALFFTTLRALTFNTIDVEMRRCVLLSLSMIGDYLHKNE